MNGISPALIAQLNHPSQHERYAAIRALDRLDRVDALDKLPIFLQALRTEPDLFVREYITFALVRIGTAALPALIGLLGDDEAEVRHDAAHVLSKIAHTDAVSALIQALEDVDARVVMKAVHALGQIKDERAIPALAHHLDHADPEVQKELLFAFDRFGKAAVPVLMEVLTHPHGLVRERVVDALASIGDISALPALTHTVQDAQWQVRFATASALYTLDTDQALALLAHMRDDPEPCVRELVVRLITSPRPR